MNTKTIAVGDGRRFDCVATRGQRGIWNLYQTYYPEQYRLNVPLLLDLGEVSAVSVTSVCEVLKTVFSLNETYRTRFAEDLSGQLHQTVPACDSLPVVVMDVDGESDADQFALACRQFDESAIEPLEDPMVRTYLGVKSGIVRFLYLEICHLAVDGYTVDLLEQTLRAELRGEYGRHSTLQPREWAAWEASADGDALHRLSFSRWRKAFETEDPGVQLASEHDGGSDYTSATLTSGRFFSGLNGLALRHRSLPAAIFAALAADASNELLVGDRITPLPYPVWVSNRHRVDLLNAHGTYVQMAPVIENLNGPRRDRLSEYQTDYVAGLRAGGVDPDILFRYLQEIGSPWFRRGVVPPLPLRRTMNFVGSSGARAPSAERDLLVQHSDHGIVGIYFNVSPSFQQIRITASNRVADETGVLDVLVACPR